MNTSDVVLGTTVGFLVGFLLAIAASELDFPDISITPSTLRKVENVCDMHEGMEKFQRKDSKLVVTCTNGVIILMEPEE